MPWSRAVVAVLLVAVAAGAQSPAEVARRVLADPRLQTRLPAEPEPADGDPGATGTRPRDERRAGLGGERADANARDALRAGEPADGLGTVAWIVLGVAVVLLVGAAIARAQRAHRDVALAPGDRPGGGAGGGVGEALAPSSEVERLAAEGRYLEALRVLLAQGIAALRRAGAIDDAPWRTSRTLLATARVTAAERALLAQLVDAVERGAFAGAAVGRGDYDACSAALRVLRGPAPGGRR
ncbi:MAG: hypothetical protein IPM29_12350 [Planctomycetes bacterium]|nr:hypothetical protein [Planctomycetota bacterium]